MVNQTLKITKNVAQCLEVTTTESLQGEFTGVFRLNAKY